MALLWMDGFDHYATADLATKWTTNTSGSGLATSIAAGGRRSSGSFRFTSVNTFNTVASALLKTLASADANGVIGFAFVLGNATLIGTTGIPLAQFRDSGTVQVTLRLNSNLTMSVVRGTQGGTVLGTTTATLTQGVFAYLEWKVLIHPSAGTIDVRLNGVSALALTAQNTRNTANSSWNGVVLGGLDSVAQTWVNTVSTTLDWDDVYVLDGTGAAPWNTFLGDCRVDARYPTGAGATTGWTPSTAPNWSCVDETAPNGDTDYVAATGAGVTDTYVVQDVAVPSAPIYGVQHCLSMKKTDAGVCTVAPVIRHSGTDNVGADLAPGTGYAYGLQVAQTNPGTGAQWTETDFNAAEFGMKRTA